MIFSIPCYETESLQSNDICEQNVMKEEVLCHQGSWLHRMMLGEAGKRRGRYCQLWRGSLPAAELQKNTGRVEAALLQVHWGTGLFQGPQSA